MIIALLIVWTLVALAGFFAAWYLFGEAQATLDYVVAKAQNGARLIVAKSMKRRYFLGVVIQAIFVGLGIFFLTQLDEDGIPAYLRWVLPVCLTFASMLLTTKLLLDARDQTTLIAYLRRLEKLHGTSNLEQSRAGEDLPPR